MASLLANRKFSRWRRQRRRQIRRDHGQQRWQEPDGLHPRRRWYQPCAALSSSLASAPGVAFCQRSRWRRALCLTEPQACSLPPPAAKLMKHWRKFVLPAGFPTLTCCTRRTLLRRAGIAVTYVNTYAQVMSPTISAAILRRRAPTSNRPPFTAAFARLLVPATASRHPAASTSSTSTIRPVPSLKVRARPRPVACSTTTSMAHAALRAS